MHLSTVVMRIFSSIIGTRLKPTTHLYLSYPPSPQHCRIFCFQLRTLQRPVAALQLYVRLLAARGDRTGNLSVGGGNGSGVLAQSQLQQTQHKRAGREAALLRVFADLCGRYPEAARVAARYCHSKYPRDLWGGGSTDVR